MGTNSPTLDDHYDVVVVGAGTAGAIAGIAAARTGAKTLIVDKNGYLGGTLAFGMPLNGPVDREGYWALGGLGRELVYRLRDMGGAASVIPENEGWCFLPQDPELLKIALLQMAREHGANLLFHAMFTDAAPDPEGGHVLRFATKGGGLEVRAAQVVDSSGDADVVAAAGGRHTIGRPGDGLSQPVSRIFWLSSVDIERFWDYLEEHPGEVRSKNGTTDLVRQLRQLPGVPIVGLRESVARARAAGDLNIRRDAAIVMQYPGRPIVGVNMTRLHGVDANNPVDVTRAEVETQLQIWEISNFFKKYIPGFEQSYISAAPHQVGVRESRHIIGSYVLTGADVLEGQSFDDQIGRGAHPFDIHNVTPDGVSIDAKVLDRSFGIPLRCLIPLDVENMTVAGRCISADHEGSSSARGQAACMVTGHAAGVAATLAAKAGCSPRELDAGEVQRVLVEQGALLGRTDACEDLRAAPLDFESVPPSSAAVA